MPQEASLSILALLRQDLPSAPAADICTDIPADPAVCERILHADPAYEGMDVLAEHLLLSVRSCENGPWKRIPEQVFLDTMGCFSPLSGNISVPTAPGALTADSGPQDRPKQSCFASVLWNMSCPMSRKKLRRKKQ